MSYAKAALRAHAAEQEAERGKTSAPHAQLVLPRTDKYGNALPPTLHGTYRYVITPWSKASDVAQQREGERRVDALNTHSTLRKGRCSDSNQLTLPPPPPLPLLRPRQVGRL